MTNRRFFKADAQRSLRPLMRPTNVIIYRRKKFFKLDLNKILFLNFFLNFFCNKEMSLNFQTTLNGKNYRGTVNINEALKSHSALNGP